MKAFYFYFLGILVLFLSCLAPAKHHYITFNSADDFYRFLNRKSSDFPLISAHRGGPMPGFPENAIETFENATTYQPVIIEFDVALSKDSALVIMHDDKLERTTTGSGLISTFSYKELQEINLKDNEGRVTSFKIPTLEEVLRWGKGKVVFTIDIKRGVPYSKVIEAVRKTRSETNSILITYNANQAAEVHRLAPDLMISVSARNAADLDRLNEMGVPDSRMIAFVGTAAPDKAYYELLKKRGIMSILGTMGNLDRSAKVNPGRKVYAGLLNDGANVLSTDELVLAGTQFDEYRVAKKLKFVNLSTK